MRPGLVLALSGVLCLVFGGGFWLNGTGARASAGGVGLPTPQAPTQATSQNDEVPAPAERTFPVAPSVRERVATDATREGTLGVALYGGTHFYIATVVAQAQAGALQVVYEDGDRGTTHPGDFFVGAVAPGSEVQVRRGASWEDARVVEPFGASYRVASDSEERVVAPSQMRIRRDAAFELQDWIEPPYTLGRYRQGVRWYFGDALPATESGRIPFTYADGDTEQLSPRDMRVVNIPTGTRVEVRVGTAWRRGLIVLPIGRALRVSYDGASLNGPLHFSLSQVRVPRDNLPPPLPSLPGEP